jgi:hypothetical protein
MATFLQHSNSIRDDRRDEFRVGCLTSIVAAVPSGATTGNVVVNASGVASNGVSFTVLPTPSVTACHHPCCGQLGPTNPGFSR